MCWAFGTNSVIGNHGRGRLQEIVNGVPGAVYEFPGLPALSGLCTSATTCLAFANEPGGTGKIVQINNGSPGPVRSVPFWASGLSCPSATECWLVGQYHPGGFGMFVIHPDGSGLTYVRSGYASFIQGMVCTTMTNCYVFASKGGNPDPAGGGFFHFVARYNGHRFRAITRVVPYGGGAFCLPGSCIGVGTQGVGPMHRRLVGVVYRLPPL